MRQAASARERERPPTGAASLIPGAIFCYFNARLLQYHGNSVTLQPVTTPASAHSA